MPLSRRCVIGLGSVCFPDCFFQQIDESIAVDSPTRSIADLTQAILKKTTVPPTLQLHMRLAVLVRCLL
jgi:hypothetical protein